MSVRRCVKICKNSLRNIFLLLLFASFFSCVPSPSKEKITLISPERDSNNVSFNEQEFKFSAPVGRDYEIIIKDASTNEIVFVQQVTATSEINTIKLPKGRLKPGVKYRWYVRVKGTDAKVSDLWNFTTKMNNVPVISNLKPNNTEGHPFGAVALTWDAFDNDNDNLTFLVNVYEKGSDKPVYTTEVATNSCVVKGLKQLTEYTWDVVARDPWNAQSEKLSASFKTKQNEPPQRIRIIAPVDGAINVKFNNLLIKWEAFDPDYEDLKYSVRLISTSETKQIVSNSYSTERTVSDLKPNQQYKIEITAVDSYGESLSQEFRFTTKQNTPPSIPELTEPVNNYRINFARFDKVKFSWKPSSDPDEDVVTYEFYITENGKIYLSTNSVTNNFTDVDVKQQLALNKTYKWYVVAKDKWGGTSKSTEFTIQTYSNTPPSKPVAKQPGNKATNLQNRIRFEWDASDPDGDLLMYDLYVGEKPDNLRLIAQNLTEKVYDYARLFEFSKTYYWKVVVKDGYNDPVDGDVWEFTTTSKNEPPTAPVLIAPEDKSNGLPFKSVVLRWKASTDKETPATDLKYYIYLGRADEMKLVGVVSGSSSSELSYSVFDLAPITSYYWRIEVEDGFKNYAYSETREFFTKVNTAPSFPYNENPKDLTTGLSSKVKMSWEATDTDFDELEYELYIARSEEELETVSPIIRKEKNYEFNSSEPGTYYWRVVVKDKWGARTIGRVWRFTIGN